MDLIKTATVTTPAAKTEIRLFKKAPGFKGTRATYFVKVKRTFPGGGIKETSAKVKSNIQHLIEVGTPGLFGGFLTTAEKKAAEADGRAESWNIVPIRWQKAEV